jgi:hypothetical protein
MLSEYPLASQCSTLQLHMWIGREDHKILGAKQQLQSLVSKGVVEDGI